jgi:hypothetical protein
LRQSPKQVAGSREGAEFFASAVEESVMLILERFYVDSTVLTTVLANYLSHQRFSADPDAVVNLPVGNKNACTLQRSGAREHMLISGIDQGTIEVNKIAGFILAASFA